MKKYGKKCRIYHIRSIQAKVKYSMLLLQHRVKKLYTLLSEKGGGE